MQKIFVVGCGGSGAKTLAYMMDQLKTTLADRLPDRYTSPKDVKLPGAWQFVSVDVPTAPESAGPNLQNVSEAGGRYISCGSSSGQYLTVDTAVSNQLAQKRALGTIATWALDNPESETTPIGAGAGQFRSIGRMLFLSKLKEVQEELQKAWKTLFTGETERELADLKSELYGRSYSSSDTSKEQPLIFVVSSMAGGAGASMAIDVCRLLTSLDNVSVGLSSLFMVTPDVFSNESTDGVSGTNPNALAMFAELAAAQFGAATEDDQRLFSALGVSIGNESIPVGRIFPVGIRSGENGAQLGDGKSATVYRALGRGLAALVSDEVSLGTYRSFTLGNQGGASADQSRYAWGATEQKNVPWGSFGYAQLSMGRDRYAEYSAQRLARSAVDRLLKGHYDPKDESPADQQIRKRLENNSRPLTDYLGQILPQPGSAGDWISRAFAQVLAEWVNRIQETVIRNQIPDPSGKRGRDWVLDVERTIRAGNSNPALHNFDELYRGVHAWAGAESLQDGIIRLLRTEIAKYGVPYGVELLKTISTQIGNLTIPELHQIAEGLGREALVLDPEISAKLRGERGRIDDAEPWIQEITLKSGGPLHHYAASKVAEMMSKVLKDFQKNFIGPLQKMIGQEHRNLETEGTLTSDSSLGVSQLKTYVPALWPDESQKDVPRRFSQAANEVFLTEVASFPGQFIADITQSAKTGDEYDFDYEGALNESARRVVSGEWESLSGSEKAPEDLIRLQEDWVSRDLTRDPGNPGAVRDPRPARFQLNISPESVLERARQYIRRPGFSFQQFISSSLREFVTWQGLAENERRERRQQVLSKFSEAMTYALPLAQINTELVQSLYGDEVRYNFNFSRIPFGGDELGASLEQAVREYPNHRPMDMTSPLGKALVNQGEDRSIDIFGSYPNYAPIVFDSLLPPIEKQWRQTTGTRKEFWAGRRARPLRAALPMTDAERNAMIRGWYIGRLVGRVWFPATLDTSDSTPVQIFDDHNNAWLRFAAPLLTPVSRFRGTLDWLPNLLESASMSWARAGEQPLFSSVEPYIQLRKIWDDAPSPSKAGRTTRGQKLLHTWLYDGVRLAGNQLEVKGTEESVTPAARLEAAKAWLLSQHNIAQQYVPSDKLAAGRIFTDFDHPYGDIVDRNLASEIPVFADIAHDVMEATSEIVAVLENCLQAGPPVAASEGPGFTAAPRPTSSGPSLPGEGEF